MTRREGTSSPSVSIVIRIRGPPISTYIRTVTVALYTLLRPVVVGSAQGLPISLIPEQHGISLMRNDVIHHGSRYHEPLIGAHDAQRIIEEKQLPLLDPLGAVRSGLPDGG